MAKVYLQVENLSKSYGFKNLFENISFGIEQGQRVSIIAPNGKGKSTLLKIIAGKEIADSGKITFNNDIRVGYLPQEHDFSDEKIDIKQNNEADLKLGEISIKIKNFGILLVRTAAFNALTSISYKPSKCS